MKQIFLSFVLIICLIISVQPQNDFIVVAIMGQSNASGYSICPEQLPSAQRNVYNFGNDYQLHIAREPIDSNVGQVDMISYDAIARCGSALSLANRLHEITHKTIVLVPCAKGGSFIVQWLPAYTRDTLYGSCINRIKTVDAGGHHKVMVFFFQGESDTKQLASAQAWGFRFAKIVTALQSDLNNPSIVFVQLAYTTDKQTFPYFDELKIEQAKINLPNTIMIKSDDLTLQGALHLNYESARIVGVRAANALLYSVNQRPKIIWTR